VKNEATTAYESPATAEFKVIHLHINPDGVTPSELVTVTATIENTGETGGVCPVVLYLAEQELGRKEIAVGSEATEAAVFEIISPAEAGEYELEARGVSHTLTVFKRRPEYKQYLLRYDDGLPDASFWSGEESYLVHFSPPSKLFTIEQVMIYGWVAAESATDYEKRVLTVNVWDKETGAELLAQEFSWRLFDSEAKWVELDVSDVAVDDEFYVEVTTYSSQESRICVDYDSTAPNEHSYMSRNGKIVPWVTWTREGIEYTREDVNWMIRVSGRAPVGWLESTD